MKTNKYIKNETLQQTSSEYFDEIRIIKSFANANIKFAQKLKSSSKFQTETKQFLIDGLKICHESIENGAIITKIFYTKKIFNKSKKIVQKILTFCDNNFIISEEFMARLSQNKSPQGIICCCEFLKNINYIENFQELLKFNKIIIVETIQNPSNLGAIIRTCDAMGIDALIISQDSCSVYNHKVLSASTGSIFRLKIFFIKDIPKLLRFFNMNNFKTYAMVADKTAINILTVEFNEKIAIVLGNEGNGLKNATIDSCSEKIIIPMKNNAESLNVSVAAGIIIWQITNRQIDDKSGEKNG
jgi:TrmH family RNA methyltransferase